MIELPSIKMSEWVSDELNIITNSTLLISSKISFTFSKENHLDFQQDSHYKELIVLRLFYVIKNYTQKYT
jgi:hypothetical protein